MTTLENHASEATELASADVDTPAEVRKNSTYAELAKAVWRMAFRLSSRSQDEDFSMDYCVSGASEFLESIELPGLGNVESVERGDEYVGAWIKFTHWRETGELSPEDDTWLRERLATRLRTRLADREIASRERMNSWLEELGLETFAPPAPPRHVGRYDVSYTVSRDVNSARIQTALREQFPSLDVQVQYVGRIH